MFSNVQIFSFMFIMFILSFQALEDEFDGLDRVKPSLSDTAPLCSEKSQDEKDYNFEEINKLNSNLMLGSTRRDSSIEALVETKREKDISFIC